MANKCHIILNTILKLLNRIKTVKYKTIAALLQNLVVVVTSDGKSSSLILYFGRWYNKFC